MNLMHITNICIYIYIWIKSISTI